jgi:hypothetical protein
MTHYIHPASLNNLTHETFVDMNKRVQVHHWCEKNFGRAWEPFDHREGRWNMVWGGHNEDAKTIAFDKNTNSKKYKVCFEDEEDLNMFKSTCPYL